MLSKVLGSSEGLTAKLLFSPPPSPLGCFPDRFGHSGFKAADGFFLHKCVQFFFDFAKFLHTGCFHRLCSVEAILHIFSRLWL